MKRYNPGRIGGYPAPMVPVEDGAYVRFEDVAYRERIHFGVDVKKLPDGEALILLREMLEYHGHLLRQDHGPQSTEVWAIEDAGITHRYIANGEAEAREIHRSFQPIDVEDMWVVRRVP